MTFGHAKAKFDLTVTGLCHVCDVPDTKEHLVCHCPAEMNLQGEAKHV